MGIVPRLFRSLGLSVPLALLSLAAAADFRQGPVALSAFGTLGGAWSSNNEADYTVGVQPTGPGRSYDFDLGMDSRIGGQLDLSLGRTTTLTAQAVADRNARDQFLPRLTLGHLRQEFLEHFTLRVGRMQNPVFLASEYRLANYPNPWVRTPSVVYDLYPLVYQDGAELSFRHGTRFGQLTVNAGYGWFDFNVPVPDVGGYHSALGRARNVHFVTGQLEQGAWRIKAAFIRGYTTYREPFMDSALAQLRALDQRAADRIALHDKAGSMVTLGAVYDGPEWLVMGEWGYTFADGSLTNRHGGYVTVGYHFDRFMPQITLGYMTSLAPDTRSPNPLAQGILDRLYAGSNQDQSVLALGLNYSVTDSVVVRGQLDLIQPHNHSNGPYTMNQTPRYRFDDPDLECLFSLSLDFVY